MQDRAKQRKKRSKLKYRSFEKIPVSESHFRSDSFLFRNKPVVEHAGIEIVEEANNTRGRKFYSAAVKGASAVLLLSIGLNLMSALPFYKQQQSDAQPSTGTDITSITTDNNSEDTSQVIVTANITNDAVDAIKVNPTELNTLSGSEAPNAPEDALKGAPETVSIRTSPDLNNTQRISTTENIDATTQPQVPTTSAADKYFVNAYRATVFASLFEGAVETPVARGTAVSVIERNNNWVKVRLPEQNIVGYIHITQLREK